MSLSDRVTDLAQAFGRELKSRAPSDHPGVARAWVCLADDGATLVPTILSSHNVATVERLGRGHYRLYFERPLADACYGWIGQGWYDNWWTWRGPWPCRLKVLSRSSGSIEFICHTALGLPTSACELTLMLWR